MKITNRKFTAMMLSGVAAGALALALPLAIPAADGGAYAQSSDHEKGKQGGHDSTDSHDDHDDSDHGGQDSGSKGAKGGKDERVEGPGGRGGPSLSDMLRDSGEDDDSDRPDWAGVSGKDGKPGRPNQEPGISKGGLYGDMYVLLRDENGVPILTAEGFVQPVDANGDPIPLDEDGHPLDADLTIEVELGRLNVGRSPTNVLVSRYEEAIDVINAADEITLDASGRLVLITDGVSKTIDSPLENLALYLELMNTGTLGGVTLDPSVLGDLAYLVDGVFTTDDLSAASSFLAAASDKTGELTLDEVVYLNTFVGVEGTLTDSLGDGAYVDFSSFTYDRSDLYADVTVTVLVQEADGTWTPTEVNIYDTIFNSIDYQSVDGGVDGFAQAADDARAVIEYIHEYEVPAATVGDVSH